MNYDKEYGWVIPSISESCVVLDKGVPVQKVVCIENNEGDNCDKCVFNDTVCKGSDINMTPFVCDGANRPDGKNVYFKLVEKY
jgi:hypothetical protein